jgi:hypothetical protein
MFTQKELGDGALERVLSDLSEEDRLLLANVNTLGWYEVEPVLRYHHSLDRCFGSGDLGLCTAAGRFSAGWQINTVLKVFVRLRSPLWLVEKATSVWSRYHDTGRWQIESEDGFIRGELRDFAVRDLAFCARLRGWLQGAVELTGGKDANVTESKCACRGHDHCVFSVRWRV